MMEGSVIPEMAMRSSEQILERPESAIVENEEPVFEVKDVSLWYGDKQAIKNVTIDLPAKAVTAIIGPSGCGKSTFLRCLNRMHELIPRTRMTGQVLFRGQDLYGAGIDPAVIRRRVGMIFQKSNPFPTMSIADNVIVGLKLNGVRNRRVLNERLEKSLRMAALWDEVKNDLDKPGVSLSGGWPTAALVHCPRDRSRT